MSRRWLLVLLVSVAGARAAFAQTGAAPSTNATPPPAAPAPRTEAELDQLAAPIALYPDSLLATLLPASAYPLEIVQAARFVKDTNNIAKLETQKWDDNVKAIARFPTVIAQMNENIAWTSDLGDAFINEPKALMDAIQRMRKKAQESGALKSTPEQVVTLTNTVVTNTVQQQTVYVTNQVVQIQSAQPEVIYVPQYNPTVVYAGYPVAYPGYYYPPPAYGSVAAASVVSFGAGLAVGAVLANNCDWGHGGCWGGSYHSDVDIERNVNVNRNANVNRTGNANANANRQKWQPDQTRLRNSGSTLSSSQSREARGWSSGSARSTAASSRAATGSAQLSPTGRSANRTAGSSASRASTPSANRPAAPSGASRSTTTPAANRSDASRSDASRSAFSGGGGSQTRSASARGSFSRAGGGSRGGGGRRR